jgi:hypothetical protein
MVAWSWRDFGAIYTRSFLCTHFDLCAAIFLRDIGFAVWEEIGIITILYTARGLAAKVAV